MGSRRVWSAFAAAVLVAVVTGFGSVGPASGRSAAPGAAGADPAPWSQAGLNGGYDASWSNVNPLESELTPTSVGGLREAWRADARQPTGCFELPVARFDKPVVVGSTLFVGDSGTISARNLDTGRLLWRTALAPSAPETDTVAVSAAGGLVLVWYGAYDCDSPDISYSVAAFDQTTGQRRWTLAGRRDLWTVGDRVIVSTDGTGDETGGRTEVRRVSNGSLVFSLPLDRYDDAINPIVGGNLLERQYVDGAYRLVAFALSDGSRRWSRMENLLPYGGDKPLGRATTLLVDDVDANQLLLLDPSTGRTRTALPAADPGHARAHAIGTRHLVLSCGDHGGALCSYDTTTGAQQWKRRGGPGPHNAIVIAGGLVYLGDGVVRRVDSGAQVADVAVWPLAVTNGHVVGYGDDKSTLRVLDLPG